MNNRTPAQLGWQKFAGFIVPILLGWFFLAWIIGVTIWISDLSYFAQKDWAAYFIFLGWLVFIPAASHVMGIVSAFCWQHQNWSADERQKMVNRFSSYLWLISFPLTILLICSCFGWLVFPIQIVAYANGVERGEMWVRTGAIDKFLGRKNDWERDNSE